MRERVGLRERKRDEEREWAYYKTDIFIRTKWEIQFAN